MRIRSPIADVHIPRVSLNEFFSDRWKAFPPNRVALVDSITGSEYTYEQILKYSRQIAAGLRKLGVAKGDIVALSSPNSCQLALFILGCSIVGAIITPMNPSYTVYEVTHHLKDSGASYLFIGETTLMQFKDAKNSAVFQNLKAIICQESHAGCISFDALMQGCKDSDLLNFPEISPTDDGLVILYSSGTTGLPKGVFLTHFNLVANLLQANHPAFLGAASSSSQQSVALLHLPMFHCFGLVTVLFGGLTRGVKLVIMPRFEPALCLRSIQKYKVTLLQVVPPVLNFLAKSPLVDQYDLSSVVQVRCSAAPTPRQLEDDFLRRFDKVDYCRGYGLTEMTSSCTRPRYEDRHKRGAVGVLLPNIEALIVDPETGKEADRGELLLRGPNMMKYYYKNPSATASIIDSGGWLHTGDIVQIDKEGCIYVVDRLKELIKYKGFQVAPGELEHVLLSHPGVAEAAVVGVASEEGGEVPKAFVVLKEPAAASGPSPNADDLIGHVKKHVTSYKYLRGGVEFVSALPKTPTGKILRRELLKKSQL